MCLDAITSSVSYSFTTSMFIGFIFGVVMILGGVYGLAPTDVDVLDGGAPSGTLDYINFKALS
jgi:hypothetical protein